MDNIRNKGEILSMWEDVKMYANLDASSVPFALEGIGTSYCDGTYSISRPKANVCVVEYILQGTGTVVTPNGVFHPKAGDSYLLRAGETHKYYSSVEDPWVKIWVNVQGTLVDPILDSYGIGHSMHLPGVNTHDMIKSIHDICQNTSLSPDVAMNRCCVAFLRLVQFLQQSVYAQEAQIHIPKNIARLKAYIDGHLDEQLTLEKCSEITYLSISQTIRSFRNAYGMPPYEYLNQQRVQTAKLLLRNSALSIQDIATQLGFQDQNYFSKYFKKKCGQSPRQYRNYQ